MMAPVDDGRRVGDGQALQQSRDFSICHFAKWLIARCVCALGST